MLLPTCVTMLNLATLYIKPYERNCGDPPEKLDPSRPLSRSLEQTRIDRPRPPVTSLNDSL